MSGERRRIFFDTEFTGLHKKTRLVSIGVVAEDGATFYAELSGWGNSFRESLGDREFFAGHVLPNLTLEEMPLNTITREGNEWRLRGDKQFVAHHLMGWLREVSIDPGSIEVWSDCLAYDWVLFCDLFGGALDIPPCLYYIPFDLCTFLLVRGEDPDISREGFAGFDGDALKHNSLHDAIVIKRCFERLVSR